jgi:hypothetical protein
MWSPKMPAGLTCAEREAAAARHSHPVRRILMWVVWRVVRAGYEIIGYVSIPGSFFVANRFWF